MPSDSDVAKTFAKQRGISKRGLGDQYENVEECRAFYDGDTMEYEDKIQFAVEGGKRKRARVNFNKVQAPVDAVAGFFAQNRRQAKFVGRVQDDQLQQLYSKNMNALYGYTRENTNADQIETEQDYDMLIGGYGAIETDLSYIVGNSTTMPNGEIIKVKLDPQKVYWDPGCKSKNLIGPSGARWVGYFEDYDLKEAVDLFQGSSEEDFAKPGDEPTEESDEGYTYNPYGGVYDRIKEVDSVEWTERKTEMVRVYNHQWIEYETFYKATNPLYLAETLEDAQFIKAKLDLIKSGFDRDKDDLEDYDPGIEDRPSVFDFDPLGHTLTLDDKAKSAVKKEFPELKFVPFTRKCYYTAVISGDHVFNCFKSVCQQGFSIKFKTGIYNETSGFYIGMVNSMMEPVRYYNKSLTELMFTIAANSKGGVMVEDTAVEDIADFESKWARTDAVIKVNDGGLDRIRQKTQGAVPTGLENIITLSDAAITSAGVDPAMMGAAQDDQSGILFKRQIKQVIAKMAPYSDGITLYLKEDARLLADYIPVWVQNNEGEFVRITGPDGKDEFMQISSDGLAAQYDVSIQEAAQTPEDKAAMALQLQTMAQNIAAAGAPQAAAKFLGTSLKLMQLDGDMRQELQQALQPDPNQQDPEKEQLKALVQQLQSQITVAQVAKEQSEAAVNAQKIKESQAKVQQIGVSTMKTLADGERVDLENKILKSGAVAVPTVSI